MLNKFVRFLLKSAIIFQPIVKLEFFFNVKMESAAHKRFMFLQLNLGSNQENFDIYLRSLLSKVKNISTSMSMSLKTKNIWTVSLNLISNILCSKQFTHLVITSIFGHPIVFCLLERIGRTGYIDNSNLLSWS